MEGLKILWLTIDRSMRVTGHFDYFREEVSKLVEVKTVFKSTKPYLAGKFSKLAMQKAITPKKLITRKLADGGWDFVMIDALFAYMDDNLKYLRCPKAMVIEDNHDVVPKWQVLKGADKGVEILFHRGNESFHRFHPEARDMYRCIWLPFAVNTKIFKPSNGKKNGVLHVGQVGQKHYPLRVRLINELADKPWFTRVVRPSESIEKKYKWPVREEYAELISQAWICVTCGSRYDAAVQKFFEIPACGTVLMSNWFKDLKTLGFENGKSMVAYQEPIAEQIEVMLEDPQRLERIAKRGYDLMHQKHTMEIRAKQFVDQVKRVINE
jgi:spore maturation protein CgeB